MIQAPVPDADSTPPAFTRELLARARSVAADSDTDVFDALVSITGWPRPDALTRVATALHLEPLVAEVLHCATPLFDRLPFAECELRGVVALRTEDGRVGIALSDAFDGESESWAIRRSGLEETGFVLWLSDPTELVGFLARYHGGLRAIDTAESTPGSDEEGDVVSHITLGSIAAQSSEVVRFVDAALHDALQMGASDIHLESDATGLRLLYRIDGVLVRISQLPGRALAEQTVSRVKVMADLDIAERRVPQDGRFKVRINGHNVDLRVSVMPSLFGEDAVLRLLDRRALADGAAALRLNDLGLSESVMASIRRLSRMSHGMVLVTGPTGSGKTTTLYAAITEIHTGRDKIVTIEDPIEYRLPGVLQIPVNEKKGLTFARGLRSILRHDPDKIMVGEIRDDETAQIAVQAALTGHLVFTTVHANNVFDVIGRFMHMGVDPYSFAASLDGIVAQRLLRTNCPACSREITPDVDVLAMAGLSLEEIAHWRFRAGMGCASCRGTGFKGRIAVAEVLAMDDELRELLATRAPVGEVKERARLQGHRPLRETAWDCVARGESTVEEVLRVVG